MHLDTDTAGSPQNGLKSTPEREIRHVFEGGCFTPEITPQKLPFSHIYAHYFLWGNQKAHYHLLSRKFKSLENIQYRTGKILFNLVMHVTRHSRPALFREFTNRINRSGISLVGIHKLLESGLITRRPSGRCVYYDLTPEGLLIGYAYIELLRSELTRLENL